LLAATPRMPDPRFAETVLFMVRHDRHGALGIIVNRPIATELASTLVGRIEGNDQASGSGRRVRIHYGGPVRPSQGMFVHSPDYAGSGTRPVTPKVAVTADPAILRVLASGKGQAKGFLAMGYSVWGPGQLEGEIRGEHWVTVFPDAASKWRRALEKRGKDL
jgi:putative transcriptional regulator